MVPNLLLYSCISKEPKIKWISEGNFQNWLQAVSDFTLLPSRHHFSVSKVHTHRTTRDTQRGLWALSPSRPRAVSTNYLHQRFRIIQKPGFYSPEINQSPEPRASSVSCDLFKAENNGGINIISDLFDSGKRTPTGAFLTFTSLWFHRFQ